MSARRSLPLTYPITAIAIVSIISALYFLFPPTFSTKAAVYLDMRERWKAYTLAEAVHSIARNKTIIVCAVSQRHLPFLVNWITSIARHHRHHEVLVIAEDYATLYRVNEKWPGHAVLIPPAPELEEEQIFGSQGFCNFTSRRPRHLLSVLELGYSVLYNDVDMVWVKDPFPYFKEHYDIYFTDDMNVVKGDGHSQEVAALDRDGLTYICTCMLFIRPTTGGKLIIKEWIKEIEAQQWSASNRANDQPAFNRALNKTSSSVKGYLLPQVAFPCGGLYFGNGGWRTKTEGRHAIIHNNYIVGFDSKLKRFREFGLWYVDDGASDVADGLMNLTTIN
ncbi:hypothetical protein KP509_23G024300 [Ceratopteris richardii]|uniref:Glycosyltransferase n=1 Tax=Ceratopteris richardii TaxID=49495 RepID=A0A8T2S188_CERRI|nr:hypothetical protein KP509_23G024300 [Ceratopteris richardii]